VAKWVGDFFNHGIYDAHIKLRKTPFLEWQSPHQLDKLIAADVMNSSSKKLSYLHPLSQVDSIVSLLETTSHSAFPVVSLCKSNSIPARSKTSKSSFHSEQECNVETSSAFKLPATLRQRTSEEKSALGIVRGR